MKKFFTWFILLTKRQLKNPFVIGVLLIIPLICLGINIFSELTDEDGSYNIGIYNAGSCDFSNELCDSLYAYTHNYRFIPYDDADSLYKDITSKKLLCGYIFPENLGDKIKENDISDSIISIKQADATIQASINEIVFSHLIKIQGRSIIQNYVSSMPEFLNIDTDYIDRLTKYYENYLQSDVTFHMIYNSYGVGKTQAISPGEKTTVVFPIRGIFSILVYLSGMFGGILYMRDRENGIFSTVSVSYRRILPAIYAFIPSSLFGIIALISMKLLRIFTLAFNEIIVMLLYVMIVTFFTMLMVKITKKNTVFASLLPVILLCSLILCPVFIDASKYIPALKFVQKIFMPYYYLSCF